ncbi:MAG: hypothetical protein Q8Q09_21345 [Deltaproteobacteria bacterium]|nr:hypothetical protein [Deltaproteobacteria bacterium]
MSRGYAVNWVTVRNTVIVNDRAEITVEMLDVICEGDMTTLLRDELARDGWTRESDGSMSRETGGVTAVLSPDGKKVTVALTRSKEVVARGIEDSGAAQALDKAEKETSEKLRQELVRELERAEGDVRVGIDAAIQRVYVEALKKRAASMGTVEGMRESRGEDGEYEVVIKVRV